MSVSIKKCRVCGNPHLDLIINLGEQSLTGVFPKNVTEKITSGPLELVRCSGTDKSTCCGLVQLRHSYDASEMYGANYGYRSGLNSSMVAHLKSITILALEKVKIAAGDLILDIGSNDCTLLKSYPEGEYQLAGIDPTAKKFKKYYPQHVKLIPEFFSAQSLKNNFGSAKAKIITSIAMFYDLEEPLTFIREVHECLHDEGIWIFEQSYLPLMIEKNAYDTICHEHLEYYALQQIKWMLDKTGLKIIDVQINDVNGGSFLVCVAKNNSSHKESVQKINEVLASESKKKLDGMEVFEKFRNSVSGHRNQLLQLLNELKKSGKTVLGYGASTKGNVILQYCGISKNEIPFIAEVNEDKFGAFTPQTHIPIISEAEAHAMKPDYFLVLPWHFKDNIISREQKFLNAGGKLIFPLPQIEVYSI